jgi:hypothetical protein
MNRFLPPLCLLLALAMLIAGFALWSVDAPETSSELSRARAQGDDQYGDVLQHQLRRRQLGRRVIITGLFAGCGLMTLLAFLAMGPDQPARGAK